MPSPLSLLAAAEGGEVPRASPLVVPQDVGVAVIGPDLEPAPTGLDPAVRDLAHREAAFPEPELAWLLFPPKARMALDAQLH